jgi:hypothetical protein
MDISNDISGQLMMTNEAVVPIPPRQIRRLNAFQDLFVCETCEKFFMLPMLHIIRHRCRVVMLRLEPMLGCVLIELNRYFLPFYPAVVNGWKGFADLASVTSDGLHHL